ncbi:type IV fimbrial biogenesis protein FimT [Xanthomonas arboricola]|uniref:GspH/FimT family pseudopilin n=1 Tax=Xanthomonas cannabis TaxID=1885674 RepID=UPI001615C469|nr:GspH/FimT family pseudopilin [Xanthomonas cannabis]MBB3806004.1 type IV fimbrial biogenesis protein FimT [Xanthomonas cannabis]
MEAVTRSSARGYTAVQLLVVMAVIAITSAIGLPSFQSVLEWHRATTRVHLLTAHLAMARSLAITQRVPISMCPSADGATCRPDRVWSKGWILFKDPDRHGQPARSDAILRITQYPATGDIDVTSSLGRPVVRFLPSGRSSGTNITISLCSNAKRLADVVVNNAGRARAVRYAMPTSCTQP